MHGFGPVPYAQDEPVFHEAWEGRLYGLRRALREPLFRTTDEFRAVLERLEPAVYLGSTYYERWLVATERSIVAKGLLTAEELEARTEAFRSEPDRALPRREDPQLLEQALARVNRRDPAQPKPVGPSRFSAGDQVIARNVHPTGHTRLPRYVRGKRGVVTRVHGFNDLPDAIAAGTGPDPQPVYSVRFEARELWGDSAEANACVYLDLWDSYLEPGGAG